MGDPPWAWEVEEQVVIVDAIERFQRGEYVPTEAQVARATAFMEGQAIRSFRRNFLASRAEADEGRPPISGSSRWQCPTHLWHSLNGSDKGDKAPRAFTNFFLGDMTEAMVVALAILAGVDVLWPNEKGEQYESCMTIAGREVKGHVDMVVRHPQYGPVPVEVKSMGERGFEKSKREGVDNTFGYIDQLGVYILSMGASHGLFVYVDKSRGGLGEDWRARGQFSPAYYEKALAAAQSGKPSKPKWATSRLVRGTGGRPSTLEVEDVRCSYCDFRSHCWPGYEQTVVSGKVKWRKPLSPEEAEQIKNGA